MFRQLRADEIDCRISICNQYGVGLLLYKDARCDQNILDETVGQFDWQRRHEVIDGRLYCSVGLFDHNKSEWVWKQDVGTESYTEREKGQASDSFKRACFNWGIGRELYTAPDMWVNAKDLKKFKEDNGRYTCRDYFKVQAIEYDGNKIAYVQIVNTSNGKVIEYGQHVTQSAERPVKRISQTTAEVLSKVCRDVNINAEKLLASYGAKEFTGLTDEQYVEIMNRIKKHQEKLEKEGTKDGV